jgi:uncharacterized membrane protein YkoI
MSSTTARHAVLALLAALFVSLPAGAASGRDHDHDQARQALQAGEILPLKAILERVQRTHPGQVMEVEIERQDQRWIYEIKVLSAGGDMSKLKVDARDGSLLDRKAVDPRTANPNKSGRPERPAGAQP